MLQDIVLVQQYNFFQYRNAAIANSACHSHQLFQHSVGKSIELCILALLHIQCYSKRLIRNISFLILILIECHRVPFLCVKGQNLDACIKVNFLPSVM